MNEIVIMNPMKDENPTVDPLNIGCFFYIKEDFNVLLREGNTSIMDLNAIGFFYF